MNFKDKECSICNVIYQPTGRSSKYCLICKSEQYKRIQKASADNYRARLGSVVGIGSGGLTKSGKDNFNYKNGLGIFAKIRFSIKERIRYCERCSKDLKDAGRYFWVIHHKDHNRQNNELSNFELLCKRCHQMEHECLKSFEGVTTRVERDTLTGRFKRTEAHNN